MSTQTIDAYPREAEARKRPQRLLALDILRGLTIAGMLLVNNPGSWGHIYAPLEHASWNGLTPTDLVFPFFMFIMGVSTYFSLRKFNFEFTWATGWKILRRTIVIFAIGLGIAWLSKTMYGYASGKMSVWEAATQFDTIRFLGVMPRLALCYGIGSILALCVGTRNLKWIIAAFLVLYTVVLMVGNGYEYSESNIVGRVDRAMLGEKHMYTEHVNDVPLHFDPEGLLSTIPSIAHMLIGFLVGGMIVRVKDNTLRINNLFILGTILTFTGLLLSYGLPINKKIWSPTFVLTTCGLASSLLGLLIWIIDIKGYKSWCKFFEAYGINPLFMYVWGSVVSILVGAIRIPCEAAKDGMISIKNFIYQMVLTPACGGDELLASLCFALIFVMFIWVFGYILYKNKIYIKI